jgi:rifampin ADP-ribosylating transferase
MEFDPNSKVIQLCLHGMALEAESQPEQAAKVFLQAWNEAQNDFEKYLTAYYVARHQVTVPDQLKWLETALRLAVEINDDSVKAALGPLYRSVAKCYEELNDPESAGRNNALANAISEVPSDKGPFYHGTKADLQVGDFLTAGYGSNYQSELVMNHIYFTALVNGAGLAASLAKGEGRERVFIIEPTGSFENDPNVTNKKFPGNPTRSYRTQAPLKITGEVTDWKRQTAEERRKWQEKLANNRGEIIN